MSADASRKRRLEDWGLVTVYPNLLGIAHLACQRCLEKHRQQDAVTAVVFSVVALESFIHELGAHARLSDMGNEHVRCCGSLLKLLEQDRERLYVKYGLAYFALTGRFCPNGEQPFQDFGLLISLRNELIHYKSQTVKRDAETGEVIYVATSMITNLAQRKLIQPLSEKADMAFVTRVGTTAVAIWAHNTAVNVIRAMHSAIPDCSFKEMQQCIRFGGLIESGNAMEGAFGRLKLSYAAAIRLSDSNRAILYRRARRTISSDLRR